jgi:hypothetical protein
VLIIVNMTPASLSGETNQDSEPNIAVDPANPATIVATAFTPDPLGGSNAPVYVSGDGGLSWQLRTIVPAGAPSTADITVSFASSGGTLYAGILNRPDIHFLVLRTADPVGSTSPMTILVDRANEDQPWVSAITVPSGPQAGEDRVYIGHNDFNASPQTASVELSLDARTAGQPAGFGTHGVERRDTAGQDGPPTRTAVHPDGTVYACFQRWVTDEGSGPGFSDHTMDVVIARDDNWGQGDDPFSALTGDDGQDGVQIATGRFIRFTASTGPLGQERIGSDLAIAVDPTDSSRVFVAWADRVGGKTGTDWTIHVQRSADRGATWSGDLLTLTNGKNPALAINSEGTVGLLFQLLESDGAAGARWVTHLHLTRTEWALAPTARVLHTAPSDTPARTFLPYLGDYVRLLAVGSNFYGVFCGSNQPDPANFPNGVTYQRNANFGTGQLLANDNATSVPVSIDPFFFFRQEPDPLPWAPSLL